MKHGKKYSDAAKANDRSVQYEVAEAIALATLNSTKQSKLISEQVVTDVMQISRSVAQLYFPMVQVKL